MTKNRTGKSMTYEEIGKELAISPQQVHKIEKEAFNKIIKRMAMYPNTNMVEVVLTISEQFGIDPDQIYKKLDKDNNEKLCLFVQEHFGKTVKGFVPTKKCILEDYFE